MQSRLAQLVAIWASGYLESTVREVVLEYVRGKAHPKIVNYVSSTLDRFANPRMEKILELVGRIDPDASKELGKFAEGEIQASVNSIVSQRHRIAHGRPSQLSMAQIEDYFRSARRLCGKLDGLFRR